MTDETQQKLRLLFICQLNAVRSPMAEGLAKNVLFEAASCGLEPASEPDELMLAVMREKGIDMSSHVPTSIRDHTGTDFDRIIAFTDDSRDAAEAIFGDYTPIEFWRVPDPGTASYDVRAIMDTYRAIRDVIAMRLERLKSTL